VGCVALEITQRRNLDCELCYLSEHSEAVRDLPLEEIFRRIDIIRRHYGPGTNVQVTGGDPTLRRRDELIAIVRRLAEQGLRPALFTNGIRARRDLLTELAHVGLKDVAFHVDTTQRRKAFDRKAILGAMRELPPHPEVPDSLRRLQEAGLRLCALTNSTRVVAEVAERILAIEAPQSGR
jgi:MoaA/NifB/PqqE/SkfB family radical SAM enzyme